MWQGYLPKESWSLLCKICRGTGKATWQVLPSRKPGTSWSRRRKYQFLRMIHSSTTRWRLPLGLSFDLTTSLEIRHPIPIETIGNRRTGKNSSYDTHLYKRCDKAGIKRVCTFFSTPMLPVQSRVVCSPIFCWSCSVTEVSKLQWIDTSMWQTSPWTKLYNSLKRCLHKWCNTITTIQKPLQIKEIWGNMKLGIVRYLNFS